MIEVALFLSIAFAAIAIALALDEDDERRDAQRRNQAHRR